MTEEFVAAISPWTAATAPKSFKPKCAECGQRVGTSTHGRDHKFSCGLPWWPNARYPLAKRNPGLAIRQPDRACWPEVAHAKRNQQYRHLREA